MNPNNPGKKKKSRAAAVAVMILLIAVSIPLGAYRSMNSAREKITKEFFARGGIFQSLESVSACAQNLVDYSGTDNGLEEAVSGLKEAMSVRDMEEMASAKNKVAAAFSAASSQVGDSRAAELQAEMDGYLLDISENSYNRKASEFNESLTQFPAAILKHISFVTPCALFV